MRKIEEKIKIKIHERFIIRLSDQLEKNQMFIKLMSEEKSMIIKSVSVIHPSLDLELAFEIL